LYGISDDPKNPYYDPKYKTHQGSINPAALSALNELSGEIYATLGTTSVHNVGVVNSTLANTLRSDVFKFSYIGNPNNAVRGQAIAPLRYNRWGTLFAIGGSSKHDGNASGYDLSFGGLMAGIDRAFWTGTRIGAYLSVSGGDVTLKELDERTQSVDAMVGMYLRQEMYYGYGLAVAGFGQDTYKTKRNLTMLNHTAESRTHGNIGTVYLERGIDVPVYYSTIQPFASFQVVSVNMEKFTETMRNQYGNYADVGLEGIKGRTNSFKMGLGTRASSMPVPLPWGQIAISGNMAWYHDFAGEQDRKFVTRFVNPGDSNFDAGLSGATFRVRGNDPKQDWFNFGVGVHLDRNSTRFFIDANLYTNERQSLFSANGGVQTCW
jgi:outer membrane autotransporter protein